MGRAAAEDMSEIGDALGISLRQQLSWHLSSNHYPPVPQSMITPCVNAIEAYNEGEPNRLIDLPDGVSWRGHSNAPATAIIEGHHLECFLDEDEDWE